MRFYFDILVSCYGIIALFAVERAVVRRGFHELADRLCSWFEFCGLILFAGFTSVLLVCRTFLQGIEGYNGGDFCPDAGDEKSWILYPFWFHRLKAVVVQSCET